MTAAYFEDHPTDPDKVILRKPKHESTWVGLTDKEIKLLANPPDEAKILMTGRMWIFVGDLMDKLKEKNT